MGAGTSAGSGVVGETRTCLRPLGDLGSRAWRWGPGPTGHSGGLGAGEGSGQGSAGQVSLCLSVSGMPCSCAGSGSGLLAAPGSHGTAPSTGGVRAVCPVPERTAPGFGQAGWAPLQRGSKGGSPWPACQAWLAACHGVTLTFMGSESFSRAAFPQMAVLGEHGAQRAPSLWGAHPRQEQSAGSQGSGSSGSGCSPFPWAVFWEPLVPAGTGGSLEPPGSGPEGWGSGGACMEKLLRAGVWHVQPVLPQRVFLGALFSGNVSILSS